jgi:hypothetical protein
VVITHAAAAVRGHWLITTVLVIGVALRGLVEPVTCGSAAPAAQPAGEPGDRASRRPGAGETPGRRHSPRPRPIISFMISVVPPKIVCTLAFTYALATGYSSM